MIILHGLYGMSDNWATFGKKFAELGFCVYIPDQRNHGNSFHNNEFSYSVMANDLKELIEEKNILKPLIIGHSMGGKVAMTYSLAFPEKVNSLIIIDMGVKAYPVETHNYMDILLEIDLENAVTRGDIELSLSEKIKSPAIRQLFMKNLSRDENNHFSWKLNIESIKSNFDGLFSEISKNKIFNGKSLFLKGELALKS